MHRLCGNNDRRYITNSKTSRMTLTTMPDIEDNNEPSKMLRVPRSTDDVLPAAIVRRIFWWKNVWVILLLSLIVCDIILDNTSSFATLQVAHRRFATSDLNVDDGSNAFSLNNQTSQAARHGSPPHGFPWHNWSRPSIGVGPLIEELSLIDELSLIEELSDPKISMNTSTPPGRYNTTFQPTIYRTLMPYVVRNGTAFHPKRKDAMVRTKRWKQFENVLSDSLKLAMKLQNEDPRLAALVTEEFPFILTHSDHPWCNNRNGKVIPMFSWFTIKDCGYSWPVPDYHVCSKKMASVDDWDRQFFEWDQAYPWESKLQNAVWRGTMTGPPNIPDWRDKPRAKLVQRSIIDQQRTLDAAFAEQPVDKRGKKEREAYNDSRVVPRMFENDYMKYRAIIDIDGNSWSSRYGYILCYNSVIIKVESPNGYMSYYESELKPWEHYIPVHSNLSDLEGAVSFAVSNDNVDKVRAIIKNAQSWCQAKLLEDQLAADLMWTLASYVELLNNEDGWHDVWEENARADNLTAMDMQAITI